MSALAPRTSEPVHRSGMTQRASNGHCQPYSLAANEIEWPSENTGRTLRVKFQNLAESAFKTVLFLLVGALVVLLFVLFA
jgi:hypothetical protein